jgi:transmembrane sensor
MSGVLEGMDGITPADVAERWYARLMAPDCSLREKEQFEAWLRLAPENALAYEDTKALWAGLGGLDEDEGVGPYTVSALEPETEPFMGQWTDAVVRDSRPTPAKPRRVWLPVGAGLAALLVVGVVIWPMFKPEVPSIPFAATAAIKDVTLEDGSNVQLDLDTSLAVRIGPDTRDIELKQGRAMFEVAHDAARPFVVDAGAGRVTALGTQFQVQRDGENVSVTLLEGSVGIDSARGSNGQRRLQLVPGQKASYTPTTKSWTVAAVDPAALTSWSQGFHVFSATPLDEAIAEINRYSNVKLKLADPSLAKLKLSGSFKLGKGEQIAEALPYALPIKVHSNADTVLLSKK